MKEAITHKFHSGLIMAFLLILIINKTFCQITGVVMDKKTGIPLEGVYIILDGTSFRTATKNDGSFALWNLSPGRYTIISSIIGYNKEKRENITITEHDTVYIRFELNEEVFLLKDVVITPGYYSLMQGRPGSFNHLGESEIKSFPQLGEDIYRAASRLPGLSVNDFSAKFYVRGGEQDEVLMLLDGMELFNPFHLQDFGGSLSTIDIDVIGEIDMITGAFPAEYGNRLSGVFNMKTRTPSVGEQQTSISLSLMYAKLLSEGCVDSGKYRWQLLARRGYVDFILGLIGEEANKPSYYDVMGKVQYIVNSDNEILAHILVSHDKLIGSENDLLDQQSEQYKNRYGDVYGWLTWKSHINPILSATTILSAGSISSDRFSQAFSNNILEYEASNKRRNVFFGLKQDWNYKFRDWYMLKWGFDFKNYGIGYDYLYLGINSNVSNEYITKKKIINKDGTEVRVYMANRFRISNSLIAELGLDYLKATWTGDNAWSPRLNMAYQFNERTTFRIGWGYYHQVHRVDGLNMVDDDYNYYGVESSMHIVAGMEQRFTNGIHGRLEGYYKYLSDIRPKFIGYRFNTDTSPENSHDRIRIVPDWGKCTGIELYLFQSNLNHLRWWLNYSYSIAENSINGVNVPREMDQRHTLNADLSYLPNEKWTFNISWNFHSGWPYTEETIHVIQRYPNGSYEWDWAPGKLFGNRFPAYHRMDVRMNRNFHTSSGHIRLFVEIRNLYNRKNVRQYDYTNVRIFPDNSYTFKKVPIVWLPIIPSFGINWEF